MYFDYIEDAYYINLDSRTDRKELFEKRTNEIGLAIKRSKAFQYAPDEFDSDDPNWYKKLSCTMSHINLIRMAKGRGLKNLWIFEDDCVFANNFIEEAQKCVDELKDLEWDIFYFGAHIVEDSIPATENIVKIISAWGAHCYVINHTFYDKILKYDPQCGIIDGLYFNHTPEDKNFYMAKKLLVYQDDDSISDLWGKKEGYKIYIDSYDKHVK